MFNSLNRLPRFLFLLLAATNLAYGSDFQSPRTAALGGAGHAGPLLGDVIYLNPSFTPFAQTHSIGVNYLMYSGTEVPGPGPVYAGNNFNISVMDGTSESLFQAGVGFTRRQDSSFFHMGAAKAVVERLGIGLGAKFGFPTDTYTQFSDATFSTTWILTKWVQAALIIDNLVQSVPSRGFHREFILGTKFNIESIVMVYLDPHYVPDLPAAQSGWGYEAGAEFPFFKDFFLRVGTFKSSMIPYQATRGDGYGIGGGWVAPKLSIEYGFSRATAPLSTYAHTFGFSVYF